MPVFTDTLLNPTPTPLDPTQAPAQAGPQATTQAVQAAQALAGVVRKLERQFASARGIALVFGDDE